MATAFDQASELPRHPIDRMPVALDTLGPVWNEDGSLTMLDVTQTFTVHPKTGERFYRSNLQVAHGRNSYTGPREIMVALLDY